MTTLFATRGQPASASFDVPASSLGLRADRTDIAFQNVTAELVRIDVRVSNDGDLPSPPTQVTLQSAPLGAFLTWQPLLSLALPALLPGQSTVVSGMAWASLPAPLPATTVSPVQLQEAVTAPPASDPLGETPHLSPATRARKARLRGLAPLLANDPLALLGRGGFHWAGNIDILMRGKSAERHMAQALRVYPGQTNAALFFVGDRTDGYRFELAGLAEEWHAELLDMTGRPSLHAGGAPGVETGEWIELHQRSMFFLLLRPPQDAERGEVQVHVQRQSDGKEAVVEFSLDPRAAGTGCYRV